MAALLAGCGDDGDSDAGSPTPDAPLETASGEAFTAEKLQELSTAEVEGMTRGQPVVNPGNVIVSYEADEGDPSLSATVTLTACDPFICWDLDGDVSEEQEANLTSLLAPVHIENPDLVHEFGNFQIAPGYEAFYNYARSFVIDGSSKAATNTLYAFYHDGTNHITILVAPSGGFLPDTAEEWDATMSRDEAESVASEVFTAFQPEFSAQE